VLGAAVELLHTSFVIHDDVIDREDRRRGRLNVSGSHAVDAWERGAAEVRGREYGAAAGLLAGDLALAAALRAVATCHAPAPTVERLLDLFDVALHVTAAGELADVRLSLGVDTATLAESLVTAERKTAVYSFALPLQAAAVLAGAPESVVGPAGEVGRLLGRAFQLVDDLQGVFGDPHHTGKSSLSDLRSGKQTALVAYARSTAVWPDLAPHIGNEAMSESQAARVRALLEESGSRDFVEKLAFGCAREALALGMDCGMPPMLVSWLQVTTEDLLGVAA
jgi:geranylgeranyl diphosphate synthase, type II